MVVHLLTVMASSVLFSFILLDFLDILNHYLCYNFSYLYCFLLQLNSIKNCKGTFHNYCKFELQYISQNRERGGQLPQVQNTNLEFILINHHEIKLEYPFFSPHLPFWLIILNLKWRQRSFEMLFFFQKIVLIKDFAQKFKICLFLLFYLELHFMWCWFW